MIGLGKPQHQLNDFLLGDTIFKPLCLRLLIVQMITDFH